MARTGRRPGNPDTREAILAAARAAFAEQGYDLASIRAIAAEAGVDPALVYHYFGTKDRLFQQALQFPVDPVDLIAQVAEGGIDGLGDRLARTVLRIWDSQAGGAAAVMLRGAMTNQMVARMLREFLIVRVAREVTRRLGLDPAEGIVRVNLIVSQVAGLIMVRYLLKIEPLASLDSEAVVALVAPTLQRYASGPLPIGSHLRKTCGNCE